MGRITQIGSATLLVASLFPFALGRWWLGDLLASGRPDLAVISAGLIIGAVALRSWAVVSLAVASLFVNVLVLAPLYTTSQARAADARRLVLAHVNMQRRPGDLGELAEALRSRRPDVLVVLEPDRDLSTALGDDLDGYHVYRDRGPAEERVAVLARTAIKIAQRTGVPRLPAASVAFDVPFAGGVVHVLALHAISPLTPGRTRVRNAELTAAASWAAHRSGSIVVLGDLNAVPWSAALTDLEHDAHLSNSSDGFGLQASWPAFVGFLGLPIDQLLYSGDLTVTRRAIHGGFGSSHRSLWVELARARKLTGI